MYDKTNGATKYSKAHNIVSTKDICIMIITPKKSEERSLYPFNGHFCVWCRLWKLVILWQLPHQTKKVPFVFTAPPQYSWFTKNIHEYANKVDYVMLELSCCKLRWDTQGVLYHKKMRTSDTFSDIYGRSAWGKIMI